MKAIKYFVLVFVSALFLTNCTIELDKCEALNLSEIPDKLFFSDRGECTTDNQLPNYYYSYSEWKIDFRYKSNDSWCTISDGYVQVETNTGESRIATISTLFNGENVKTITVEQKAAATGNTDDYIVLQSDGIMVQKNDLSSGAKWSTATNLCESSRVGGYSDWRLPTRGEINVLYDKRATIGGFSAVWYWTGDNYYNYTYYHFALNFSAGEISDSQSISDNDNSYRVRAVRTLP